MRKISLVALAACGAALALGIGGPARAQQTPTPPVLDVGGPGLTQNPAAVSDSPIPVTATTPDPALVIPAPPNMTVQVEMDLHDDDLLGVFKSLLRGVGQAAGSARSATEAKPPSAKTPQDADIAAILNNADLSDVLKDVTHIHFVLYQSPAPPAGAAARRAVKPGVFAAGPTLPADPTAFYETAFSAEGGRRIIYVNDDPLHVLMTTFGKGHGFAFLVQSPGSVGVLRADGYPDLSKLAALATSVGTTYGKSVMDDAMKPDAPKK